MKLNVCCTLVKENLSKENNPLRNFWSFSKANIYLKRLFSSKVIHKSVFGLANREKSPLITQITLTTGLKNHQTPKKVRARGEGITFITIRPTSRGERGSCGHNRFPKVIYGLNLTAKKCQLIKYKQCTLEIH